MLIILYDRVPTREGKGATGDIQPRGMVEERHGGREKLTEEALQTRSAGCVAAAD
jgi:hypothetical protein